MTFSMPTKLLAGIAALGFLTLATFHYVPPVRYQSQLALTELSPDLQGTITTLIGEPYVIHDAKDDVSFRVSLAHRLPTRYIRDIWFWARFREGDPFAVEATTANRYGVTHIIFGKDARQRDLVFSVPSRAAVCVGHLKGWVVRADPAHVAPVYVVDEKQYVVTVLTDGSDRWKAIEHPC